MKFLSESLARQYHVLKATNGKHALNVLEKEDIDLVVSDIMMPEMDGLELCSTIKNDIRYSHIPIILLTAKASEEHQLEGLSVGADDYITKPFNMEVLKLRINKIIEMNVKRQEIFNQDIKIEPSRITITPLTGSWWKSHPDCRGQYQRNRVFRRGAGQQPEYITQLFLQEND